MMPFSQSKMALEVIELLLEDVISIAVSVTAESWFLVILSFLHPISSIPVVLRSILFP